MLSQDVIAFLRGRPIAMLCTAYRKILLAPQPVKVGENTVIPALQLDWGLLGIAAAVSFALLFLGYATFNKLKWKFMERP